MSCRYYCLYSAREHALAQNAVRLQLLYSWLLLYTLSFVLQLRLRVEVMLFFGLTLVLLWVVHPNSCASNVFVTLGIMPMQVQPYLTAAALHCNCCFAQ